MANTSISNLTAGAAVSATDLVPNVQTVGVGPVKTTAAQLKTFMSASPTLVTPAIGAATGTSLALNGATLGSYALALLGNASANQFITPTQTLTDAATITWNANLGAVATVTITSTGRTLTPSNLIAGGTYIVFVVQGSGGSKTITTWTNFKWPGGVVPTLSTAAGAVDIISGVSDGTYIYANANIGFA